MDADKWSHFLHLLFRLYLFVTFIFVFENSQNSFSCGPPFGAFWSVKYLNFAQKLPLRTTRHIFLERKHRKVTKNSYYVSSTEGSQKKVSAHGLVGQGVQNCLNWNLFLVSNLENGLQAISSSTTNVFNLWKWHYLVFCKFLRKLGKWDKASKTV